MLQIVTDFKHLGITQTISHKTAKGTLFSFNCIHKHGINPITSAKLYMSTVLPKAFFSDVTYGTT